MISHIHFRGIQRVNMPKALGGPGFISRSGNVSPSDFWHHRPDSFCHSVRWRVALCVRVCVCVFVRDPPSTVTVARAVRTGMVKMEQVYSPSSDSCTSPMVMESSVGVERCSWMRLSLSAGGRRPTRYRCSANVQSITSQDESCIRCACEKEDLINLTLRILFCSELF